MSETFLQYLYGSFLRVGWFMVPLGSLMPVALLASQDRLSLLVVGGVVAVASLSLIVKWRSLAKYGWNGPP